MTEQKQHQIFKKLEEIDCPFCHKNFFVGLEQSVPCISCVITETEIDQAKRELKNKLDGSQLISEATKKELYKYIDSTPLSLKDVDPLLQQIIREEAEKQAKKE